MAKEEKKNPQGSFNLLEDSVFGQGPEIIFEPEGSADSVESVKPKVEESKINYEEGSGEPLDEEDKKVVDLKAKTDKETAGELETEKAVKPKSEDTRIEEDEVSHIAVFASYLGDKGIVDFDPETFKDSEEGLIELVSNSINKGIQEYKTSKSEEVQMFLDFVDAGGSPKKFHEVYYNQKSWENFEVRDDNTAKIVIEEYLRELGEEDEEIQETIETLEVGGILEKKAKTYLAKIQKFETDSKKQLLDQQKKFDADQKLKAKEEYDSFKKDFYSKEEIQGFKLTPVVKDKLWSYMTSIDKKTGLTPLQKHNQENTNAQYLYGYLAMNDWDLSKLAQKEKTKAHSELADKLRNFKDGRSKIKSGQSDSFGDQKDKQGNFSAFRKVIENNQI